MNAYNQLPAILPAYDPRALALPGYYGPPPVPPGDRARKIFAIVRRRWLPFLAVFLTVVGAVAAYTLQQTPQYIAAATLLVNSRILNSVPKENVIVPQLSDEDKAVSTEMQILQSTEVARRVIKTVDAGPQPRFASQLTGQPMTAVRADMLGEVMSRLKIGRPGGTNVVEVGFRAADPVTAARVANEFINQYIGFKTESRLGAARSTDTSLRGELDRLRLRVENAEAAVAAYRRQNNLLSAEGSTLTERDQSLYNQQDAAAQTQLAEDRARLSTARAQLRRGSNGGDVGEALGSSVVNQLRGQRAIASAELAQLQARYQPSHPKVVKARQQLEDIDRGIQAEIGRVVSNLEARVSVSQQRAGVASGISGRSRGQLASNAAAGVGLAELERRADALRSNYAGLLARQTAVASEAVVADNDARLLSSARVPQLPAYPNRKLNLALGLLLGLIAASAVVAVLQLLDQKLISSQEAEAALGIPHIANVPSLVSIAQPADRDLTPIDFVAERPLSLFAEAMRGLLLTIEHDKAAKPTRIVGITSARPGEGKSTLAASLARASALSGRRTLLIDGDIRSPSVARIFGKSPTLGLLDVLLGQAALKDVILQDERSGAWLLPSMPVPFGNNAVNLHAALKTLMGRFDEVFDLVIVDTAPALAVVESRLLMSFVDKAILVVRWKHTSRLVARTVLRQLASIGIQPIGVVMTQVDMKALAAYAVDDVDHGYASWAY